MTKKKSFAEAARSIGPTPETATPETAEFTAAPTVQRSAVEYRKFTVPLRSDQLSDITQALARLTVDHDVVVTKALLIRLAIDEVLAELHADPDEVLHRLYELERRELDATLDRRVSVSHGVEAHLRSRGRL